MPIFNYQARDQEGRVQNGSLEAAGVPQAIELLTAQGLVVTAIHLFELNATDAPTTDRSVDKSSTERPEYLLKLDAILANRQELIGLLEAAAQEQTQVAGDRLTRVIKKLQAAVVAEDLLSDRDLLAWLPVIVTGGNTEAMRQQSKQLAARLAGDDRRINAWYWALSYPLFLLICASAVLLPLYVWIVPPFKQMFREFGLRLPAPTMLLITISDFVIELPLVLLVVALAVIAAMIVVVKYWNRMTWTSYVFGVFTAGSNPNLLAMSRLTSALAEMLALGAPLPNALLIAGSASRFAYYQSLCRRLASELAIDADALMKSSIRSSLPPLLVRALISGPNDSPSVSLLRTLSDMYVQRTKQRLMLNAGFATPLIIFFIGAMIGFVIIALFLPLVNLMTSLT